jgi:serine/threonine-protein kinase
LTATLLAGRYRIIRRLGAGGMAVVELADDMQLERRVAIKLLRERFLGDGEIRTRFVREARSAARLSHPNVVRVFDAGEAEGRPFIVMEYVEGETLAAVRAGRRTLPPAEVVGLGIQACAGLQEAHEHGLIHRDVKPQNLIVHRDGTLKIADFGIVRGDETTRLTHHGTILGTAAYLAPEQAAGDDVSPSTDVYALGAVLYELLTGRPPYEFDSLAELADKQRSGEVVPVRDVEPAVPDALEAVVMRCLARDPTFRYRSAAELATSLRASLDGPPDETATVPLPARASASFAGMAPSMWIGAAVLLAAIGVTVGILDLRGHGGSTGETGQRRTMPVVAPIARGKRAVDEARNLSAWLRANSR